jgi:hypothetical protein
MIPLTSTANELEHIVPQVRAAVQATFDFHKAQCPVKIGTMIGARGACFFLLALLLLLFVFWGVGVWCCV